MKFILPRKFLLLLTLWTGIFCNYACYSIIAPFFPQLARRKGLSPVQYSLVFGAYSLSQVLFSIIVGKSLTKIGEKFVVVSGLFLTGGATILFGCLERCPGGPIFFWLCIAVRTVEGAGFAAYLTSSLAVVVRTFPKDPGYYVGLTETIVTVAMISGPPLGSFLYTVGGYSVPFASFGSVIMLMSLVSAFLIADDKPSYRRLETNVEDLENLLLSEDDSDSDIPDDCRTTDGDDRSPKSLTFREYRRILRLPAGAMVLVNVTCNVCADAFILISLSDHLSQFHLTPMTVGWVYLCLFLSYGLSSPLAGLIADKMGGELLLQCGGCIIMCFAFLLIGPGTFLTLTPKLALIVAGLLLKGVGAGPLISCSYSAALKAAKSSGLPEDFRMYSLVSTLVSFSIAFGNLLGGITTGVMCEHFGMQLSTTLYSGVFLLLAVVCLLVHLVGRCKREKAEEHRWKHLNEQLMRVDDFSLMGKNCEKGEFVNSNVQDIFGLLGKKDTVKDDKGLWLTEH